jgi:hypothetical protein
MANTLFNPYKASRLTESPSVNVSSDTIKVALVDTGVYTFSANDQYYSAVSSAVVGTPVTLGSKTTTNGVFDAADPTFSAVTGNSVEALVVYKDTGNASTSPLIAWIDTVSSGLPVTPNGGDIVVQFNASGVFAI